MNKKPAKRSGRGEALPSTEEADEEGLEVETTSSSDNITQPFDPTLIRVEPRPFTVDLLLSRIRKDEIDLQPAFQRHDGIWSNAAQSRLIESLLIRIPLPAFYMDATDDEKWVVVDGLQRLSTLRRFILEQKFSLQGLEFQKQLEGKTYDQLPRSFQRRILETTLTLFLIQSGTPPEVKFNIFKRINTGGLPLSTQEIRHALNQGKVTEFLEAMAESREFRRATANGISPKRMGDRECVLRFLAFTLTSPRDYREGDFDAFLNDCMAEANGLSEAQFANLSKAFLHGLSTAHECFGKYAFRKRYSMDAEHRSPINKALFETWTVNLSRLDGRLSNRLIERKKDLQIKACRLMNDRGFEEAVSQGTGDTRKVRLRSSRIAYLIEEVLS